MAGTGFDPTTSGLLGHPLNEDETVGNYNMVAGYVDVLSKNLSENGFGPARSRVVSGFSDRF